MSTRTYALRSKDKPDWMVVVPIEPPTDIQWKVIQEFVNRTEERQRPQTASTLAIRCGCSESTARKALKKLVDMGLARRGTLGYYRKRYV